MYTHLVIKRPAFSSFLKAEVAEFATKTIGIVREREPETLLISPVFNPLLALEPEIKLLSIRYGIDPERIKVDTLKSKLMLTISNLKLQVRLVSKSTADEHIYLISGFINTYLRKLHATKNDKVMLQQVEGFMHSVATDAALDTALDEHSLSGYVNLIKNALYELRAAMTNRLELLASRPTVNTLQIRASIANAIHNLLKGIEVAQFMNPEVDYKPLIDELNELVSGFRLSIRLRIANNKRKAEEEKANAPDEGDIGEEGTPSENGTEGVAPTSTSIRSTNGFAPYRLAVAPVSEVGDALDEEEDDLPEGDVEHADESVDDDG